MSAQVFPTFIGAKINVRRSEVWATKVSTSGSGKETMISLQSTPRYRYVVEIELIRTSPPHATNEVSQLRAFISDHRGRWDSFLFNDPILGSQVRVRFEDDEIEFEQFAQGFWLVKNIKMIQVKT